MKRTMLLLLLLVGSADAGPADSVIRISSHGGSGTIIATGDGWSLVLTCAHCFEGKARAKAIVIDMPHPAPSAPARVGITLLACGNSRTNDLALLRIGAGPLPYVTPVAPLGYRISSDCLSVGYDEMKFPAQVRPARIVGDLGRGTTLTDARPWHGRSGGALIEKKTGHLVGVVSAYSGPSNRAEFHPGANGIYVSHDAILRFLIKAKAIDGQDFAEPEPCPAPFRLPGGT